MPTKARPLCGSSSSAGGSSPRPATKQRSIYDFFSQPVTAEQQQHRGRKLRKTRRSLEASAKSTHFRNAVPVMPAVQRRVTHITNSNRQPHDKHNHRPTNHDVNNNHNIHNRDIPTNHGARTLVKNILNATVRNCPHRSISNKLKYEDECRPKRIDYDDVLDDDSSDGHASFSTFSSAILVPTPQTSEFCIATCSQRSSEPDTEPTTLHTPVRRRDLATPSPNCFQTPLQLPHYQQPQYAPVACAAASTCSQDELDFLTPRDQPVVPLSNPNTPSPMKKRARQESDVEHIPEEQVQNLTQDLTHMDVRHATRGPPSCLSSQSSMDVFGSSPLTKKDVHVVVRAKRGRQTGEHTTSLLSAESYVNPFAPELTTESGKKRKISRRKRRSFPLTWVAEQSGSPLAKYLSDFSEIGLIGSGSFSKVYKCIKKIDGWEYAVKKNKRHFRGKADTERALREVQALAALSSSNHVVRYFDAWIEDDLLYIQLEHLEGCSLATFVNKYAPHKVPEEVLCKLLCHIAQALYDMHGKKMVHMDVKLQNVLVGPGEVYKLGDLGTVAHLDGSMEITEGDNRYLSRELLEGNRNNLRAGDIFALGATIYELALGTTLASGGEEWQKIRDGDLVMFRQYSNSLQHLIASMMHPDALQRPLAEDILQHEVVLPFR